MTGLRSWTPDLTLTVDDLDGQAWDMPEEVYHQDPWRVTGVRSLSSTTAKHLLPPSTPAHARQAMLSHEHKAAYDFGSTVHALALGRGATIVRVDADDWRSKAARDAREESRAEGLVALLGKDLDAAQAAADAILRHPNAAPLLARPGAPEVVLTWREEVAGALVPCRAMLDRWPDPIRPAPICVDIKTTNETDDASLTRSVESYGYRVQEAFYRRAYYRVHGVWPGFAFVFVEKTPPHEVVVVELDDATRDDGEADVRDALATWQQCLSTDTWPGRPAGIRLIGRPRWARRDREEQYA